MGVILTCKGVDTWVYPMGINCADIAALVGKFQTGALLVQLSLGVVVDGEMELPHTWMTKRIATSALLSAVM